MTKLDPVVLEAKFIDGTFTTETTTKQVQEMLPKPKKRKTKQPSGKAIIKARDKAWADIQADPNLRREIETKLAKTPPMPDKDQLLAMVEQAMVGDKAFQAAIETLLVKATGRALKDDRNDDDDGVDEVLRAIADKPLSGEHRVTPLEDAISQNEQNGGDPIPPPENAPSVVPAHAPTDTRTAAEIMGTMPDNLRRVRPKPKPSFAPEALQELIDAGVDPDEAAERLQEQIERWS